MNSTQKRTSPLKSHKLAGNEMNQPGRTKTASTNKAVGLSDEMIREFEKDPDMHSLIKLHTNI